MPKGHESTVVSIPTSPVAATPNDYVSAKYTAVGNIFPPRNTDRPGAVADGQGTSGAMTSKGTELTPLERWALRASNTQFHSISGALGGFASGIATCPLDVIKTKLQAQGGWRTADAGGGHVGQPKRYNGLLGTGKIIWRDEGFRGMYRGLGPIILGYLPTWAVYFTMYDKTKKRLKELEEIDNEFMVHLSAAVTAGACSTIVTNPIWVIKTRLMSQSVFRMTEGHPYDPQTQPPWHYKGTIDAAKKMYKHEGIKSFYSGLTPALLGLTHVAVQFPAYEYLRMKFTGKAMGDLSDEEESKKTWKELVGVLGASVISKVMASSATYPHEVIRTRLQTQRRPVAGEHFLQGMGITPGAGSDPNQKRGELKYRGVVQTFRTILHEEGWRAFYAGMGTNMMRAVPAATVTMFTYEYYMGVFRRARRSAKQKTDGLDENLSL